MVQSSKCLRHAGVVFLLLLLLSCYQQQSFASIVTTGPSNIPLPQSPFTVISIVDITGMLACLIKIHSILKSTKSHADFEFKFLVLNATTNAEGASLQLEQWNEFFQTAFPHITSFESKLWSTPTTMPKLRQRSFEKDYIFCRFYLADIFPTVQRYVYLDNDLVVTADLVELFQTPLVVSAFVPTSGSGGLFTPAVTATTDVTTTRSFHQSQRNSLAHQEQKKAEKKRLTRIIEESNKKPPPEALDSEGGAGMLYRPCIGFVYERHTDYNRYIEDNFNRSHPLVQETERLILSSLFMNGGVALVNASCWRERKMRHAAEALMEQNTAVPGVEIYGTGAGDQAVFYLLLQHRVTYLHARWNMRRLPTKTVHMLDNGRTTGIVHYAGYTHGSAVQFCLAPTHLPLFIHNVVPLYLAVAASFANHLQQTLQQQRNKQQQLQLRQYNNNNSNYSVITLPSRLCNEAVSLLHNYHLAQTQTQTGKTQTHAHIFPNYAPGLAGAEFRFPPTQPFP